MKTFTVNISQFKSPDAYKARSEIIGKLMFHAVDEENADIINEALAEGMMFGSNEMETAPHYGLDSVPFIEAYSVEEVKE